MKNKPQNPAVIDIPAFLAAEDKAAFLYEAFGCPRAECDNVRRADASGRFWKFHARAGRLWLTFTIDQWFHGDNNPNDWDGDKVVQVRDLSHSRPLSQSKYNPLFDDARLELDLDRTLQITSDDGNQLLADYIEPHVLELEKKVFGDNFEHGASTYANDTLKDLCLWLAESDGRADSIKLPTDWVHIIEDDAADKVLWIPQPDGSDKPFRRPDDSEDDIAEALRTALTLIWNKQCPGDPRVGHDDLIQKLHWKKLRDKGVMAIPLGANDGRCDVRIYKAQGGDLLDFDPYKMDFIYLPDDETKTKLLKIEDRDLREAALIEHCNTQIGIQVAYLNNEIYRGSYTVDEYAALDFDPEEDKAISDSDDDPYSSEYWRIERPTYKEMVEAEEKEWTSEIFKPMAEYLEHRLTDLNHKFGDAAKNLVQVVREKDGKRTIRLEPPPVERSDDFEQGRFICAVPLGTPIET